MLGIRKALRFAMQAEVRDSTLTFVQTAGRTSIPLSLLRD